MEEGLFILAVLLMIYLFPWILASHRKAKSTGTIAVINIFLGWTFIGWVISFAMACGDAKKEVSTDELKDLKKKIERLEKQKKAG